MASWENRGVISNTDLGTSINRQRLYIGGDAYTAPAVYVNQGSGWALYSICRDYLGNITHLVNSNGTVNQEYSYDAWGRLRNPSNQVAYTPGSEPDMILNRGYTGHEHLKEFGLINMNARLYDPAIGRFLSPDPYVQDPFMSQNFNRYSYVLNNPLRYTDPSGEFLGIAAAALFFVGDLLSNLVTGTSKPFKTAYNNASNAYNGMSNALQFPIYTKKNSQVTAGLDPFALGVSVKGSYTTDKGTTFAASGGYGILQGPFVNGGIYQQFGDVIVGGGAGWGSNAWGWNVTGGTKDYNLSYGKSYHGNAVGPDGVSNRQTTGTLTANIKDVSIRIENDVKFLGDGKDRWRSSAVQIGYKDFFIGKYVYTNSPDTDLDLDRHYTNRLWKKEREAYADSDVYSSPFYFGFKQGGRIERVGFNHPGVQNVFQNGWHAIIGSPFFYTPHGRYFQPYLYTGFYNPFTLYTY